MHLQRTRSRNSPSHCRFPSAAVYHRNWFCFVFCLFFECFLIRKGLKEVVSSSTGIHSSILYQDQAHYNNGKQVELVRRATPLEQIRLPRGMRWTSSVIFSKNEHSRSSLSMYIVYLFLSILLCPSPSLSVCNYSGTGVDWLQGTLHKRCIVYPQSLLTWWSVPRSRLQVIANNHHGEDEERGTTSSKGEEEYEICQRWLSIRKKSKRCRSVCLLFDFVFVFTMCVLFVSVFCFALLRLTCREEIVQERWHFSFFFTFCLSPSLSLHQPQANCARCAPDVALSFPLFVSFCYTTLHRHSLTLTHSITSRLVLLRCLLLFCFCSSADCFLFACFCL